MASTQPAAPWRGYVNQLTYGANLRERLSDEAVDRIVDALLAQQMFTEPVEAYYQASIDALRSGQRVAALPDQDEDATRDALSRITHRLDDRRPWPVHPFYQQDVGDWPALATAPVIGRVPLSEMEILDRLSRLFDSTGPETTKVMILKLRTGPLVALRTRGGYTTPGIDLLAHTDPESTLADFHELTGLEVERVSP
jgi:hypothetical protein